MEPVIYLNVPLEDGTEKCIEIPLAKFHLLRQSVASLMKDVSLLEEKRNNM